jgi:methionine aminopeptidase
MTKKSFKVGQIVGIILGLIVGGAAVDYVLGVKVKPQSGANNIYSP